MSEAQPQQNGVASLKPQNSKPDDLNIDAQNSHNSKDIDEDDVYQNMLITLKSLVFHICLIQTIFVFYRKKTQPSKHKTKD